LVLVRRPVQNYFAQPRLVTEPEWRDQRAIRKHRPDQALSVQCDPYRGVSQPGRITGGDNGLSKMEMIAVPLGRADENAARFFARP